MADVRSLLRSERATRHIDHPLALYSATGTLECSVCHIPLKSDVALWEKHLASSQHAMRAERHRIQTKQSASSQPKPSTAGRETSNGSKKRKASDVDQEEDNRKKTRPAVQIPSGVKDEPSDSITGPLPSPSANSSGAPQASSAVQPIPKIGPTTVDESEWAAFEASLARPPSPEPPNALTAAANISAAPLSAAELAAQSRDKANTQTKDRREIEIEGEKEDATRALEEEFDEMEGLEDRVKRLREKREALRKAKETREGPIAAKLDMKVKDVGDDKGNSDDDDDDDDDFDEWGAWRHQ